MSETTTAAKTEGAEKKPAGKKAGPTPAELLAKEAKKKKPWTLEKCMKAAHRFKTEAEWSAGAPASYKSAQAHGWIQQCMGGAKGNKPHRKSA